MRRIGRFQSVIEADAAETVRRVISPRVISASRPLQLPCGGFWKYIKTPSAPP